MSAFFAALRLSRRDAARFKGRSALIMVMIGLPVLVITGVLTLIDTTDLSVREELPSRLGSVADVAVLSHLRRNPVDQDPAGRYGQQSQTGDRPPAWTTAEVTALTGGRLLPFHSYPTEARLHDGYDAVDVLEIDLRDRLSTGMRPLVEGRFPAGPQEVAITPALLDEGVRVGGTLQVTRRGEPRRVVGVVEQPNRPGTLEVVALYDAVRPDKGTWRGAGWLADTPAPVTWEDVRRLNQAGLRVASRAVIESPRAQGFRYRPNQTDQSFWMPIAVLLVVTETVLLAGPAFAVGLRRRRRELATIAAQGGSPGHLRTIVLADGLVLGGAAALIGAALGIGAGLAAEAVAARSLDWTSGPPDVSWRQVLGVAALGLVSALVAAVVPAVQAARQSPAQVLAGRPGEVRDRAGRPLLGSVLVLLGLGAMLGVEGINELGVVASATVVLFGLIALTPWLVRLTGRFAGRLPLPARLSVRDGARHRSRTASAVAAVMAATMGAVTVGLAYNTMYVARQNEYRIAAPEGTMTVSAPGVGDQDWSELRAAFHERLPGVSWVTGLEVAGGEEQSLVALVARPSADCSTQCAPTYLQEVAIGDARLLALFQGRQDPRAAAALAAGKAVVFAPRLVDDGTVEVSVTGSGANGDDLIRVPAVVAAGAQADQGGAVLPASALTEAGFKTAERRIYALLPPSDWDRVERGLQAVAVGATVSIAQDNNEELAYILSTLLVAALILALGGTFAATGLAVADMRRDLDTLSAVGGRPRTRRMVVASQAGYIAGLGAVLGLAGGAVTGVALSLPLMGRWSGAGISVPWAFLAALVLGLPLLAALLAGLFTRTRLERARRAA